jgi:hypothetical protein
MLIPCKLALIFGSPALGFFLWREMPPSDTGEGRARKMSFATAGAGRNFSG